MKNRLRELRAAIARGDGRGVERYAHSIKGSAGNFAARTAWDVAERLEEMGREQKLAGAEETAAELDRQIQRLRPALAELCRADGDAS